MSRPMRYAAIKRIVGFLSTVLTISVSGALVNLAWNHKISWWLVAAIFVWLCAVGCSIVITCAEAETRR